MYIIDTVVFQAIAWNLQDDERYLQTSTSNAAVAWCLGLHGAHGPVSLSGDGGAAQSRTECQRRMLTVESWPALKEPAFVERTNHCIRGGQGFVTVSAQSPAL
jgi:hypothetical protein